MKANYPTQEKYKKKNLTKKNKRLMQEMKYMSGIMYYFQTQTPKKANGR